MHRREDMKCSIITIHHIHNFGSVFQAYSLYHFLEKNGYDAELIDYRPTYFEAGKNKIRTFLGKIINLKSYCIRKKKFERFVKTYDRLSNVTYRTLEELKVAYQNKKEIFIAGGDQLWNNYHICGKDDAYKLDFVSDGIKISYSTSMGRDNFNEEELQAIANKTKEFKSIMLREKITVSMLAKYSNVSISHVIDPVGLLDVGEFKRIAQKPTIDEPYAVMYLADSSEILDGAIDILSKKLGLKIVHICGFKKKCYCDKFEKGLGPEEILGYILHADFVISASFHATMFSLIFNKQFAALLPGAKTNARIEDILKYVGLEDRIINSLDALERIEQPIEYEKVNLIMEEFKRNSAQALLETLRENCK